MTLSHAQITSPSRWQRFLAWLGRHLLRFGVFVICWALCATLFYQYAKPDFRQVATTAFFDICAYKLNEPANAYPVHRFDDIKLNPSHYHLCDKPTQWQSPDLTTSYMHMALSQRSDDIWYLRQWSDSLGDPMETLYRVDNGVITPIFYRTGTQMMLGLGIFFGLFLGFGLSKLFWFIGKTRKTPPRRCFDE